MTRRRLVCTLGGIFILSGSGLILSRADDSLPDEDQLPVAHAECTAFGGGREKMIAGALSSASASQHYLSVTTGQVIRAMTAVAPVNRIKSFDQSKPLGTID